MDHVPEEEKKTKKLKQKNLLFIFVVVGAVFVGVGFFLGGYTTQKRMATNHASILWRGIDIGTSGPDELVLKLGQPLKTSASNNGVVYYYPGQDNRWPSEVLIKNNEISFIKEHLFYPSNIFSAVIGGISSEPTLLYSKSNRSGNVLYVYGKEGLAVYGNKEQNVASEVFRFSNESLQTFMIYLANEGYSTYKPKNELFGF